VAREESDVVAASRDVDAIRCKVPPKLASQKNRLRQNRLKRRALQRASRLLVQLGPGLEPRTDLFRTMACARLGALAVEIFDK
jgi:hypothetical protein